MKETYQVCIKVCPIWKDIYGGLEKSRKNMKHRKGFPYDYNQNKQWRLVLVTTFHAEDKNLLPISFAEACAATAYSRMEKIMKPLTDKFECQCFYHLVEEYVRSYNICQSTKFS